MDRKKVPKITPNGPQWEPQMDQKSTKRSKNGVRNRGPKKSPKRCRNGPRQTLKNDGFALQGLQNHKIQGSPKSYENDPKIPPEIDLKSVKTRPRNRTQKTPRKSPRKARETTAQGSQNGAQNAPKIIKKQSLGRLGGLPAHFGLKRWSRRGGYPPKPTPKTTQKEQKNDRKIGVTRLPVRVTGADFTAAFRPARA